MWLSIIVLCLPGALEKKDQDFRDFWDYQERAGKSL